MWLSLRGDVMCLDGDRCGKIAQVRKRSILSEQQVEKLAGGGKPRALLPWPRACGSPDFENNGVPGGDGARFEQAGKLTGMIDVQMSQKNDVGVREREPGFTEPDKSPRAGIDEYPRGAIDEHEIAGRGASGRSRSP